jgi:hypothetical protein
MLRSNRNTPKKTPIKGTTERKVEAKPCSECGKVKTLANKTKRLCATCVVKLKKEKQKIRKEYKKRIKQETVTQTKLDQITSWLVRAIHKNECHACGVISEPRGLQCAHFVGRTKMTTRFNLLNLLPACPKCNLYTPHHVWNLGKSLNKIFGEDTTERMLDLSSHHLKLSNYDRKLVYDVYRSYLTKIEEGDYSQEQKYDMILYIIKEYEDIINPLIKNNGLPNNRE